MATNTEGVAQESALAWLQGLGQHFADSPAAITGTPNAGRVECGQVVLERSLQHALAELNIGLPALMRSRFLLNGRCQWLPRVRS